MKDHSNYGGETTYNLQDASVSDLSAWLQEVDYLILDLLITGCYSKNRPEIQLIVYLKKCYLPPHWQGYH